MHKGQLYCSPGLPRGQGGHIEEGVGEMYFFFLHILRDLSNKTYAIYGIIIYIQRNMNKTYLINILHASVKVHKKNEALSGNILHLNCTFLTFWH